MSSAAVASDDTIVEDAQMTVHYGTVTAQEVFKQCIVTVFGCVIVSMSRSNVRAECANTRPMHKHMNAYSFRYAIDT